MKANETKPPFAVLDTFKNTVTYFSRCTPDIRVAEYAAAFDKCAARIEEQRSVITDLKSKKAVDLARDASVALSEFIRGLAEGEPFSEKAQASLDAACENIAAWSRLRPSIFGKAKCSPDEVASLAVSEAVLRASLLSAVLDYTDKNIARLAKERAETELSISNLTDVQTKIQADIAELEKKREEIQRKLDLMPPFEIKDPDPNGTFDGAIWRCKLNLNSVEVRTKMDSVNVDADICKLTANLLSVKSNLSVFSATLEEIEMLTSMMCAIEQFATEAFVKGTPAYGVPTETLVNFLSSLRAAGPLLVYPQKALDACMVLGRAFEFYANKQEQNGNN